MKSQTIVVLFLAAFVALTADGQLSSQNQEPPQETQARGYWVDPATGLMWAGKDNGKDVSWKKAIKFCRDLRLAGYSDWRLANIGELGYIYDPKAESPGLAGMHDDEPIMWHVKGNLFLTGHQWSSTERLDDRERPSGYVFFFNFNEGSADEDPTGFLYPFTFRRALCVRGTGA